MITTRAVFAITALALVAPVLAQTNGPVTAPAGPPGRPDAGRILAGTYKVDTNHTQVVWTVEHLGITPLNGAFGASGGSLEIDPAKPAAAKVTVTFNIADISTTSKAFAEHLLGADLFEAAKFGTGSFASTAVAVTGSSAHVTGNLTLKGITRPVTLDMKFHGAGINPTSKKLQIGFAGTTAIKRSDFGLGFAVPRVADAVQLNIVGAFEKVG